MKKLITLSLVALLFGCASEQETIHKKQIEVCKDQIKSGQQPTEFCLALLPEYRGVGQPNQGVSAMSAPAPQYDTQAAGQPQYLPAPQPQQPVIVQQPAQNSGMTDMLVGGLIGHALGSSNQPAQPQYAPSSTRIIERRTVIQQAAPTPKAVGTPIPPTIKPNYMDMSKLSSSGARPSTTPAQKPNYMDTSKLSAPRPSVSVRPSSPTRR